MNHTQAQAVSVWDACYHRIDGKQVIPIAGVPAEDVQKKLIDFLKDTRSGMYHVVSISRPACFVNNVPEGFDDWWIVPPNSHQYEPQYLALWLVSATEARVKAMKDGQYCE